ncbi:MAG: baseplate J/gp47 family protein [Lachnospiraceae bacterium]|nr:baseplate J/gp47 family protein [Lachnospiraceae bacterium]
MFEDTTYEVVLQRMLDRVSDRLDKREGSLIWDTHSPTAIEFQILYMALDDVVREAYGDTATRKYLILRCKERGIAPYESTKAILRGEFEPPDIDVSGKRFNIEEMNYRVLDKLSDGVYTVQCETAGTIGNRYLGRMIPIEYIRGLESAELVEVLIPGEDEEETEALRQRYFDSFDRKAFGGNVQDYLEKVNAIPGVGSSKVTRVWNGDIHPADLIPSDAVKEWYRGIIGTLEEGPAQWLRAVFDAAREKKLTTGGTVLITLLNSEYGMASETLVETVQNTIDPQEGAGEGYGLAPIGHVVSVKSASGVEISVRSQITFESGYGWERLQESVDNVISGYLAQLRERWAESGSLVIRISQIETRILGIRGVEDITATSINGRMENLTLSPYEVPVFGGVSG